MKFDDELTEQTLILFEDLDDDKKQKILIEDFKNLYTIIIKTIKEYGNKNDLTKEKQLFSDAFKNDLIQISKKASNFFTNVFSRYFKINFIKSFK